MSKKIEDILSECIEAVKAGTSDIDGCLKRHPSLREELEPLLKIATSIQRPPDIGPSREFKVRARASLMEHIHAEGTVTKPWLVGPVVRAKRMAYAVRLKAATVALAVVASVCGLGGGLAYASQDSLPGDNLYSVKLATEQLRRVLTTDDVGEVELELVFADTRVEEMAAVAHKGYERLGIAVDEYGENIALALENAENIGDAPKLANALEILALATSDHIKMLDLIKDAVTKETGYGIQQATEIAFTGHVRVLRDLAAENPLRAAAINLATMESRLNRAQTKAGENQIDEAEAALGQFEELSRLSEEISQISKGVGNDTALVDELNARATSAHLEVLGIIYGEASEPTKETVENAMAASAEAYGQAVKGLQEKGVLGDIPEQTPIPEDIPENVKKRILKPEANDSGNEANGSGNEANGSGNGQR